MKKYKFIDFTHDGIRREMFVKSSDFGGACLVANAFMTEPACIGWGPCHG